MPQNKQCSLRKRAQRARYKLSQVSDISRPRLTVFRSHTHIYAQIIQGDRTVASASTLEKSFRERGQRTDNRDAASVVGECLADRAQKKGVKDVVFDRGGRLYHGRIAALAEAARSKGLNF